MRGLPEQGQQTLGDRLREVVIESRLARAGAVLRLSPPGDRDQAHVHVSGRFRNSRAISSPLSRQIAQELVKRGGLGIDRFVVMRA